MKNIYSTVLALALATLVVAPLGAMHNQLEDVVEKNKLSCPEIWLELHSKLGSNESFPLEVSLLILKNLWELTLFDQYNKLIQYVQKMHIKEDSMGVNLDYLLKNIKYLSDSYPIHTCVQLLQKSLIQADIKIDTIRSVRYRTALHRAVVMGYENVVKILLALVDDAYKFACACDAHSWIPLHDAESTKIVKLLLATAPTRKDAVNMINKKGKWSQTSLGYPKKCVDKTKILTAYLDENISDEDLKNILEQY